jgi:hypothetical protein
MRTGLKCEKRPEIMGFLHDASRFALRHLASWLRHSCVTLRHWRWIGRGWTSPGVHRTIRTGRELDGQTYDDYPEVAGKEPPSRRIRLRPLDELGSV